jgi:DNA repair protein RadC
MKHAMPNDFKKKNAGTLPRERFREAGRATALTSEELLAILLKTGAPGCDVMELSRRLIAAFGGTGHLVKTDLNTLKAQIAAYNKNNPDNKILGIGEAKRMELAAAFELVRREYASKDDDVRKVSVKEVDARYRVFRRVLNPDDRQESFCVLLLDSNLLPVADPVMVFRGTLDGTTVHPREVFQEAVRWGAYAIMVAHNHPGGNPAPSAQDVELTRKLLEVSRIMAIPLLDHIIIGAVDSNGGKGFVSMRDSRFLEFQ